MIAQCVGPDIERVAAQPNAGYVVDPGGRGPETLEVTFQGREEESGRETKVNARCSDGVPRFTVENEGDDE